VPPIFPPIFPQTGENKNSQSWQNTAWKWVALPRSVLVFFVEFNILAVK
jgi:hypothetical protein